MVSFRKCSFCEVISALCQRCSVICPAGTLRCHGDCPRVIVRYFQLARFPGNSVVIRIGTRLEQITFNYIIRRSDMGSRSFDRYCRQTVIAYERSARDRVSAVRKCNSVIFLRCTVRREFYTYRCYLQRSRQICDLVIRSHIFCSVHDDSIAGNVIRTTRIFPASGNCYAADPVIPRQLSARDAVIICGNGSS